MNSNLFTNTLPDMHNQFGEADLASTDFTSWEDQAANALSEPFQNDGPQMQSWSGSPFGNNVAQAQTPSGLFAAIARAIEQYFHGSSEQNSGGGDDGCGQSPFGTTAFQNVNLSSVGDPHDAISGTRMNGGNVDSHWDSMQSHGDLLSAPSIAGGLRFSSQVGAPNNTGATMNQSITATADRGCTAVTFNANGDASVRQGCMTDQLVPNETLALGPGLSVTDQGSSLVLHGNDANGGILNTTLSENGGGGVDMTTQGNDITLGGYLVNS